MNRKSGSGSGPFLMEMLIVAGFFIVCASICILVFVKADNISRDARDMNQAVLKAQSLAESLKAGKEIGWSDSLPDRNIWEYLSKADRGAPQQAEWGRELAESGGYEGMYTICWNSSWEPMESHYAPPFLGVICLGDVDGMKRADIRIMRYGDGTDKGEQLYRLQTETYVQETYVQETYVQAE